MPAPGSVDGEPITVGRIGAARGVRGHVFVQPFTDDPQTRFSVGSVLATAPTDAGPLTVESLELGGAKMVLTLRRGRGPVRGRGVARRPPVVAAADRPPIEDPDEFYASDLVGLAAPDGRRRRSRAGARRPRHRRCRLPRPAHRGHRTSRALRRPPWCRPSTSPVA